MVGYIRVEASKEFELFGIGLTTHSGGIDGRWVQAVGGEERRAIYTTWSSRCLKHAPRARQPRSGNPSQSLGSLPR
jgi:hypothetical protein